MKLKFYVKHGRAIKNQNSNYIDSLIEVFPYVDTTLTQKAWVDENINIINVSYSNYPETEYSIMPILIENETEEYLSETLDGFVKWI